MKEDQQTIPLAERGAADAVHRSIGSVKSFNREARTVDVVCSTDMIDSYGDSVEQKWSLDRYKANPVVLYAHNGRDLPIGRSENVRVTKANGRSQLECTVRFASAKANPVAEQIMECFAEEILRGVSVGFIPKTIRYEMRDGKEVCVLSDNELHELSVTPVPANPEALAKSAQPTSAPRAAATENQDMDQKQVDELLAKREAEVKASLEAAHAKALEAKDAEVAELEKKLAEAEVAKAASDGDAKTASEKALALEIDALVGKKILPVERDTFVALAKTDRALFEKMLATRKDLSLFSKALPPEEGEPGTNSVAKEAGDDGSELGAAITKRATEILPTL